MVPWINTLKHRANGFITRRTARILWNLLIKRRSGQFNYRETSYSTMLHGLSSFIIIRRATTIEKERGLDEIYYELTRYLVSMGSRTLRSFPRFQRDTNTVNSSRGYCKREIERGAKVGGETFVKLLNET